VPVLINLFAVYISGVVYITLSLIALLKYRRNLVNEFSNTEKINFNWLLYLIGWMVVIWMLVLFVHKDKVIFGAAALFVLWLGYFGIKQVQIFHHQPSQPLLLLSPAVDAEVVVTELSIPNGHKQLEPSVEGSVNTYVKYQKSNLSDEDATLIHELLKILMDEQKPFTNPDLTLNDLAKSLDVHPNQLSQVINSKENKSFYDLVNEKRIHEFTRLISQPSHQQYTLVSIAYDCGFNSKASFNRNFKKYTGLTPTEYVKGVSQKVA
jgi:AraC-like DNA-binding protein